MKYEFEYDVYNSISELNETDQYLVNQAFLATNFSYSPYSNFKVGSCAITNKGNFVIGSNQENSSFPVTVCSERILLAALSSQYPGEYITTIAINYIDKNSNSNTPITPCGVCRQSLLEHEMQHKHDIRHILASQTGKIYIIKKGMDLLPLPFSLEV